MIAKREDLHIVRYQFQKLVKSIREDVLLKCGYKCVVCCSTENLTVDHILALSLGGSNDIDNLQILCKSCNSKKGGRRNQKGEHGVIRTGVNFRFDEDLIKQVQELADKDRRSLTNYIEQVLHEKVEAEKQAKKKK